MGVTISTHNRSDVAYGHNIRDPKIVSKEAHIDLSRPHEIWHDEKLADAYDRIFGAAVERYNERQKRADRKITNYLDAVKGDATRKPVYEMIIGVYGSDCSTDAKKEILREFVDGWKQRNPNLEMIGAYYHADEEGKDPHVHIDYVPVAHGYKRGMDTQNGLVKALGEMGIEGGKTMKETAQIKWEKRENEHLERLCTARGLVVEHPGTGKKHLDTPEYKQLQDELQHAREINRNLHARAEARKKVVRELDEEVAVKQTALNGITAEHEKKSQMLQKVSKGLQSVREGIDKGYADIDKLRAEKTALTASVSGLREEKATLTHQLEQIAEQITEKREDLALVERAIKRTDDQGGRQFGASEWQRRIAEAKEQAGRENRLRLFEKFVALPQIKPLWEQFCSLMERGRGKKRNDPNLGR